MKPSYEIPVLVNNLNLCLLVIQKFWILSEVRFIHTEKKRGRPSLLPHAYFDSSSFLGICVFSLLPIVSPVHGCPSLHPPLFFSGTMKRASTWDKTSEFRSSSATSALCGSGQVTFPNEKSTPPCGYLFIVYLDIHMNRCTILHTVIIQ